jgi:hypothetical protein
MVGSDTKLALRYAIYRTHLAEQHINVLYGYLKQRFPADTDFLDSQLDDWQREVGQLHDAFLQGNGTYPDKYEQRFK